MPLKPYEEERLANAASKSLPDGAMGVGIVGGFAGENDVLDLAFFEKRHCEIEGRRGVLDEVVRVELRSKDFMEDADEGEYVGESIVRLKDLVESGGG